MIDRVALLGDLQRLLRTLAEDLRERSESLADVRENLGARYRQAQEAQRTSDAYETWRADQITQVAAAWVLSCVFARFLEDNQLVDPPRIAGPGERLRRARDEHELYFRRHPTETDREYLLDVFAQLAQLPGVADLFGPHNALQEIPNWLSGDAAGELLRFFQQIDANTGALVRDFTDPAWDTRFLGDLYQDLSEAARKKYALLQTPEFIEEFILDRTLEPALEEFGLRPAGGEVFRLIDPACGSGHFLLGAFRRLLERWQRNEPAAKTRDLVQRSLDSIYGVDVNPYAVAIARFRLLLAAMRASGVTRLVDAPTFRLNLACGDSLLHGTPGREQLSLGFQDVDHVYFSEDLAELRRILRPGTYHAVVANPPYITPKDRALNQAYRDRFSTCHMKYSLAVPFMQRIFDLAMAAPASGDGDEGNDSASAGHAARGAGYIGQITANSFMKREFGKKLIEEFFPQHDLTHVIDTSGAYIPGHGTPTVILFGRNRRPVASTLRTVMGIRGEPSTPDDPARGLVWSAIVAQLDQPGSQSEFVSVGDSPREAFHKHPWSIGGGGAAELKEQLDEASEKTLSELVESIGITSFTLEDDVFILPRDSARRLRMRPEQVRPMVVGDIVRDWQRGECEVAVFPYDEEFAPIPPDDADSSLRYLWLARTCLANNKMFGGKTKVECGLRWFEFGRLTADKLRTPLSIVYGEVATHNHFVLDRGGKVFNRTAPVIKLPAEASEDDHLALLGLLNSSTACFWMKQVCHQKQMMGGDGIRIESKAKVPYAFNATALGHMPVPNRFSTGSLRDRLIDLTRKMIVATECYATTTARCLLTRQAGSAADVRADWENSLRKRAELRSQQILLQEEIDFTVYCMFGLAPESLLLSPKQEVLPRITEGCRPFCITEGTNEDGFSVPQIVPEDWPEKLKLAWIERGQAIMANCELRLIESSNYKRRWIGRQGLFNHQRTDDELGDAAREWLLDRLESYFDFDGRMNDAAEPTAQFEIALVSVAKLADAASGDGDFLQVGELYRGSAGFDVEALVAELVEAESVPLLPVLRYKPSGRDKRQAWERTWELQRQEDALDARTRLPAADPQHLDELAARELKQREVGKIPVPPKYASADFLNSNFWRLRGKLDVPKERWISFPHSPGADGTLVVAWAGYDHLQLARAIAAWYVEIQERVGGPEDPRLVPLLAGLQELVPWLRQWHNEVDPEYQQRMGDYFADFVQQEAHRLGLTLDDLSAWQPPAKTKPRSKKSKTK